MWQRIPEIAGGDITMGPMSRGPRHIKVTARVKIQQPNVRRRNLGDMITFAVRIPLLIELIVDLRPRQAAVHGRRRHRTVATARAAEPLMIVIDVASCGPSTSPHVTSNPAGRSSRIIGGVDGEIRKFVAAYVAEEIDSPASATGEGHRRRDAGRRSLRNV